MKPLEKQEFFCQENRKEALHQRGLIPGPSESFAAFLLRSHHSPCREAHPLLRFHIQPDWVPIYRSAQSLSFWEAAATWIEEHPDQTRSCSIQLKPSKPSFLYSEEEILSHELVHAVRLLFDEPRFEEILAFQTSPSRLRRYFGPLLTRSSETLLFLLLVCLSWIGWTAALLLDCSPWGWAALGLPFCAILFALGRLIRSQSLFSKARNVIAQTIRQPEQALTAMLYLTDAEIHAFAHQSPAELLLYARTHDTSSPRWAQWVSLYL